MKRVLILAGLLSLSACASDVKDPKNLEVVIREVPVPVECQVEINKAKLTIEQAQEQMVLEEQTATLRATIAEQQAYIIALESGIIGCGGKIK